MGKKKIMVPYRDSVLTKLLQNALGGNRYEYFLHMSTVTLARGHNIVLLQ